MNSASHRSSKLFHYYFPNFPVFQHRSLLRLIRRSSWNKMKLWTHLLCFKNICYTPGCRYGKGFHPTDQGVAWRPTKSAPACLLCSWDIALKRPTLCWLGPTEILSLWTFVLMAKSNTWIISLLDQANVFLLASLAWLIICLPSRDIPSLLL